MLPPEIVVFVVLVPNVVDFAVSTAWIAPSTGLIVMARAS